MRVRVHACACVRMYRRACVCVSERAGLGSGGKEAGVKSERIRGRTRNDPVAQAVALTV